MAIFKEISHQKQFDREGVISLPALNGEQIVKLNELYRSVTPLEKTGIYSNVQDQSAAVNYHINDVMIDVFGSFLESTFKEYTVSGGSFLVKHGIPNSASQPHQDYNLVDESKYTSLSIWCPLIDVDEKNGCLQVILGSHRCFNTIRSINIPSIYLDFDQRLEGHLRPFPVKAGTAVVYAHNLFHGSKPNQTDQTRVAAVVAVVPKDAVRLHYLKGDTEIQIIKGEEKFFYESLPALRSEGKLVGIEPVGAIALGTKTSLTVEEFYARIEPKPKKGLVERFFARFSKN